MKRFEVTLDPDADPVIVHAARAIVTQAGDLLFLGPDGCDYLRGFANGNWAEFQQACEPVPAQ